MKQFHKGHFVTGLPDNTIFVFGSNEAGRHGKGAALVARQHFGAIYGQGYGVQGTSFAIPTKDRYLKTLTLYEIQTYCEGFINKAIETPELTYYITDVGCGLAGYSPYQIAPLFRGAPDNCIFPISFKDWL